MKTSYSALRHSNKQRCLRLDVSDWLRMPAPFNLKKHGPRAIFSGDNSVVERLKLLILCLQDKCGRLQYSTPLVGIYCYYTITQNYGCIYIISFTGCVYGLVSGCVLYLLYHVCISPIYECISTLPINTA